MEQGNADSSRGTGVFGADRSAALRARLARLRLTTPVPDRADLSPLQDMQRRRTAQVVRGWINSGGHRGDDAPDRSAPRAAGGGSALVVVVTDLSGLVAMDQLIRWSRSVPWLDPRIYSLLQEEAAGCDDLLDRSWMEYTTVLSTWEQPDREFLRDHDLEARFPLGPKEAYWTHHHGYQLAPLAGFGAVDLWKWTGHDLARLQEEVTRWIS